MLLAVVGAAPSAGQEPAVAGQLRGAASALQKGRADEAVQFLTDALADRSLSNDRRGVILNDRGVAYLKQQNIRAAIDDFNRAAQLYPEYAPLYSNRGNALIAVGQPMEAIKDFDRALVLAPQFAAAFANRAVAHARLGAHDRAIADFTRAIDIAPQAVAAFTGRGQSHLAMERPHAAIRDFTRAATIDARHVPAYRNRAEAKLQIERFDDAAEDLSRALTFDSKSIETTLLRGEVHLVLNNAQAALKDFNRALELDPRSIPAFIGRSLAGAKTGAMDEALNDLAKAIELDPRQPRPYAVRAALYVQAQKTDLAAKDVERALKLGANSADAHWAQGELEQAQGQADAATAAYSKALGINPRHRGTLDALARLGLVAAREETELAGAGVDQWRVMQSGDQFAAVSEAYPNLRVPLEMLGAGTPKLIEFERKKAPFANIAILRFASGTLESGVPGQPSEALESSAIIDVAGQKLLGLPLSRRGVKTASWTWEDGKLAVTSADGLTEQFVLRGRKDRDKDGDGPVAAAAPRRSDGASNTASSASGGSKSGGTPSWAPWAQPSPPQRQASRPQKPKSLFEMLFGN
jgi:tetratricopeptide (TPR) repeat protein